SRSYSFGPLERRGLVGGLRPSQIGVLGTACATAIVILRLAPNGLGLFLALVLILGGSVLAFLPVSGRTPVAWLPVVVAWLRPPRGSRPGVAGGGRGVGAGGTDGRAPRRSPALPRRLQARRRHHRRPGHRRPPRQRPRCHDCGRRRPRSSGRPASDLGA